MRIRAWYTAIAHRYDVAPAAPITTAGTLIHTDFIRTHNHCLAFLSAESYSWRSRGGLAKPDILPLQHLVVELYEVHGPVVEGPLWHGVCGDLAAEACVGEEASDYAADEVVAGDPVVGAADELGEGWVVVDDHVLVVALGGLDEVV